VDLNFSDGSAVWTASAGYLSSQNGQYVTWTAPDRGQTVTITAQGATCTAQIQFTVIPPSTVCQTRYSGTVQHTYGRPDIGIEDYIWVGPDSVSFYNIVWQEGLAPFSATGVWDCSNGRDHGGLQPCDLTSIVEPGLGTMVVNTDFNWSGDCGHPPPFPSSQITALIPQEFNAGESGWAAFAYGSETATLDSSGHLHIEKLGAYGDCDVDSPSSDW
jgi:hypothetical protein